MGKLDGFGAALKALRQGQEEGGKPMTLQALQARTGIHYTNLSGYEKEQEWPSRTTLERLLDGLGISLIDLAVETDRQARIARGEEPGLPAPLPAAEAEAMTRERVEAIVEAKLRETFRGGLSRIAGLPSADIQALSAALEAGGVKPDLEAVALLDALLKRGERG